MKKKLLLKIADFSYSSPWKVVLVFLILSIIMMIPASRLKTSMKWSDMLPEKELSVRQYNRVLEKYKTASALVVILEGDEQNTTRLAAILADSLRQLPNVKRVNYRLNRDFFYENALKLSRPSDLKNSAELFTNPNLVPFTRNLNHSLEKTYVYTDDYEVLSNREKTDQAIASLTGIRFFLEALNQYYRDPVSKPELARKTVDQVLIGDEYLFSYDRKMLMMNVIPDFSVTDIEKCANLTHSARSLINTVADKVSPQTRPGLSGMIAMASDEMDSMDSMGLITMIAFVLILFIFIYSFRMWASPLLAGIVMIVAIIFSAGIAAILYGSLNIMTAMFAVILFALIIDFSIHIISNFQEQISSKTPLKQALEHTLINSGGGIFIGASTTALSFLVLLVTENRGMKEFGGIVGSGVLIGMLVTLLLLPALLVLYSRKSRNQTSNITELKALGNFAVFLNNRSRWVLALLLLISAFLFLQAINVKFDYNMLNIEPKDMKSMVNYYKVIEKFDMSTDNALITFPIDEIDSMGRIVNKAKQFKSIAMAQSITDYMPLKNKQMKNINTIKQIKKQFQKHREIKTYTLRDTRLMYQYLDTLWMNITEMAALAFQQGQIRLENKCYEMVENPGNPDSKDYLKNLIQDFKKDTTLFLKGLQQFQEDSYDYFSGKISGLLNEEPIRLETLPADIREQFMSDDGKELLVTLYPQNDVWDIKNLKSFRRVLREIDPSITGTPIMFLDLIHMIAKDGKLAISVALILIFIFLLIDFRNLRLAIAAMVPLIFSLIWLIGIMKILGIKFNVVNVIALPLVLGIGIDDGVHFVHRYLSEKKNIYISYASTGKAALLTTLTTVASFGSLALFPHRGMASMGIVLGIGIALCWITTVLFLSPLLKLLKFRGKERLVI